MYKIRIDELNDEKGNQFTVYGFDFFSPNESNAVKAYPDIFFDREYAERFIEALNNSDIDERQIPEIIDDVLCDLYTL